MRVCTTVRFPVRKIASPHVRANRTIHNSSPPLRLRLRSFFFSFFFIANDKKAAAAAALAHLRSNFRALCAWVEIDEKRAHRSELLAPASIMRASGS